VRLIDRVTSDEVIERAYKWVCERRKHYHHNSDVWQLRRWWDEKKRLIVAQLRSETAASAFARRGEGILGGACDGGAVFRAGVPAL
jgi:hypothetical protein